MSTNETLGKMLKYYRRLNNLKVRDVKARLEDYDIYISEKTIYGWESNQNPPSADKFLILCEIYKIPDINFTFLQKKAAERSNSVKMNASCLSTTGCDPRCRMLFAKFLRCQIRLNDSYFSPI